MGVPKHFPYLVPPSGPGILASPPPRPATSERKEALRPHRTVGKPVSESDPQSKHQLEFLDLKKKKKFRDLKKENVFGISLMLELPFCDGNETENGEC